MTTASAADVMASLNSLKANGLNNDGASIQTDGAGNIITPTGQLRNVAFITPFHMFTNPTLNNGVTRTDTYTGGSTGVPIGATAVIMGIGVTPSGATGYVQIYPGSGTAGQYVSFSSVVSGQYSAGMVIVPLNGSGQATIKANGANIILQDWWIYGYII